jgi:O-acetyl-ADP-ribose deacetylase (regulator of RNase III)
MRTQPNILHADITTLTVDAIVNAANSRLIPGGGVDGAINKAAGPELANAMMTIGRCATGEAVITPGFKLRATHVIHTVAPIFAQHKEADVWRLLANCYRNSLALAAQHAVESIAFPSLGTGVYGSPSIAHARSQSRPFAMKPSPSRSAASAPPTRAFTTKRWSA